MQFQSTTILFALLATSSAFPLSKLMHPRQLVNIAPNISPTVSPSVAPSTSFLNGFCFGLAVCNPVTVDKSTNSNNNNNSAAKPAIPPCGVKGRQLINIAPTVSPVVSPAVAPSTGFLNNFCFGLAVCNPVKVDKSTNSNNNNNGAAKPASPACV